MKLLLIVLLLSGCASKELMINCEKKFDNVYECEKP